MLFKVQLAIMKKIKNFIADLKKGKKIFKKNKKHIKKLAEHIGLFPVVMITPYDINLILDGSDARRRFFDALIAQFDKNYLLYLLDYNKLLKQRNAFLKTKNKAIDLLKFMTFR